MKLTNDQILTKILEIFSNMECEQEEINQLCAMAKVNYDDPSTDLMDSILSYETV